MNSLAQKLMSSGAAGQMSILSESPMFDEKDFIQTDVPILNIALSGDVDGGLTSGLTFIAGESRNFKSLLGLILVKAYLDKHEDAMCMFYNSEFGITKDYITNIGIDPSRVVETQIEHLEQLKFHFSKTLENLDRKDKVIIFIDSVGNLASKKELVDALDEKSVADMTRAKVLKSLWRIITPTLTIKDIPCVAVNHTYKTMELYSKSIMSGGTGNMLSANQVFFISKTQDKDGKDLTGFNFTVNIEKSRFVREKSKFPLNVQFEGFVNKWSGLMDIALECGVITKPKQGWYAGRDEEKMFRLKDTNNEEFWDPILESEEFKNFVKSRYKI
tara:strand:- start:2355 stop:3344 length:990 start_codon:yes stop_codon:yes gene_type:complete